MQVMIVGRWEVVLAEEVEVRGCEWSIDLSATYLLSRSACDLCLVNTYGDSVQRE